jgi:AcrR family transcriptional regulator
MVVLEHESGILARRSVSSPVSERPRSAPAAPISEGHRARAQLADRRRELYRAAIVEAAEAEFAERGYDDAKVAAIAKRAGVSLATFYASFGGKWEVFRALQQDRLDALMLRVGTEVLAARDAFERLRAGLEGYLRFHMEHPQFLRVQLRERVPWGTTDELRTPEQTRAWELGLQMLTATFAEAAREGLLVDEDAELCARTATAMSQVRLAQWMDRKMVESRDDVAQAAMRQLVRAFAVPERADALLGRLASP